MKHQTTGMIGMTTGLKSIKIKITLYPYVSDYHILFVPCWLFGMVIDYGLSLSQYDIK